MRRARGIVVAVVLAGVAGLVVLREPESLGQCDTHCLPDQRDPSGCCPAKPPAPSPAPTSQPRPGPKCASNEHPSGGHCCRAGEEWVDARGQCVCLDPGQCGGSSAPSPGPAPTSPPPPPGSAPDLSPWVGSWASAGSQTITCGARIQRQPLNGVGPIVKDAAPAKIATGAFPCQLKWDVDSTSTTATLAPPQICVVKGVNLLMTGGSMRRNGNAIAWTATLTVNDCSIVQYSTWTKM